MGGKTRRVKHRMGGGPAEDLAFLKAISESRPIADILKMVGPVPPAPGTRPWVNIEVKSADNGDTPLIIATELKRLDIVKVLLALGANVRNANDDGDTSLGIAMSDMNKDIAEVLVANLAAKNDAPVVIRKGDRDVISQEVLKLNQQVVCTKDGNVLHCYSTDSWNGLVANAQSNGGVVLNPLTRLPINDADLIKGRVIYRKLGGGAGGARRKTRKLRLKSIKPSHKAEKKWDATFIYADGHQKVVPFGAKGMSDYTKHRDPTRKQRYLKRHSGMGESWQKPDTPGALAKWVLWNKPSLRASIADYKKRFKL